MRKLLLTFPLSWCFLLLLAVPASACLCLPESPEKAFARAKKNASTIFVGEAIAVVDGFSTGQFRGWRATFKVKQYWKGTPGEQVVVFSGETDCATSFEAGEEYLVFAVVPKGGQQLETSVCMQTGLVRLGGDNLKRLGKGKTPKKQDAILPNHTKHNNGMHPTPHHAASHVR
ncbi:MAG TPA: hypothetical protein VF538_16030 [Pyrinomonadaceae bacterium]|jgi:hypothetical protein